MKKIMFYIILMVVGTLGTSQLMAVVESQPQPKPQPPLQIERAKIYSVTFKDPNENLKFGDVILRPDGTDETSVAAAYESTYTRIFHSSVGGPQYMPQNYSSEDVWKKSLVIYMPNARNGVYIDIYEQENGQWYWATGQTIYHGDPREVTNIVKVGDIFPCKGKIYNVTVDFKGGVDLNNISVSSNPIDYKPSTDISKEDSASSNP